jgi:hypothetical protein
MNSFVSAALNALAGTPACPFERLARNVVRRAGLSAIASKKELAALAQYQRAHVNANQVLAAHSPVNVDAAYRVHQVELQTAISEGRNLDGLDGWSRGEYQADFAAKASAASAVIELTCDTAAVIARAIGKRLGDAANSQADELEAREKADSENFDIKHQPSPAVTALRTLGAGALKRIGGNIAPARMISYLDLPAV